MKKTLYRVTYPDGTHVIGTARQLVGMLSLSTSYIRELARTGETSRKGIRITVEEPGDQAIHSTARKYYVATNPDEDPIVGSAAEISALTEISDVHIRYIARHKKVCRGWSVREATDEEWREFDEAYGNP